MGFCSIIVGLPPGGGGGLKVPPPRNAGATILGIVYSIGFFWGFSVGLGSGGWGYYSLSESKSERSG